MLKNAKIKLLICIFLHVFVLFSVATWELGKVDGQRSNLLVIEAASHHLHHWMFHIASFISMHHRSKDLASRPLINGIPLSTPV